VGLRGGSAKDPSNVVIGVTGQLVQRLTITRRVEMEKKRDGIGWLQRGTPKMLLDWPRHGRKKKGAVCVVGGREHIVKGRGTKMMQAEEKA